MVSVASGSHLPIYEIVEDALEAHARIQVHLGRRRCGTVEVTTHLGVARCKGLQNALIRTHVYGEAMDCPRSKESVFSAFPSVTLIS